MSSPSLVVVDDYDALGRAGADIVASVVRGKHDAALLVATGETPMGVYRELARRRERGAFDGSRLRVVQLDEYLGPSGDGGGPLLSWMLRSFVDPLAIPHERVVTIPTDGDLEAGCIAFDRAVEEAGGIDLAILGLGTNGHLGFNEPPSERTAPTRVVELTEETIRANARYAITSGTVPRRAVTAGMRTLLGARRTLLLAAGPSKHDVIPRALEGPVTPDVPASFLREAPAVTLLLDRAAWGGSKA